MALFQFSEIPGEKYPSKVSAIFDTAQEAQQAADALAQQASVASDQVHVIAPDESRRGLKLEPEPRAIRNTWVRKHAIHGAVGIALGLMLATVAINSGVDVFRASPVLTTIAITWVTFLSSLMLAGALTLRLDHDRVINQSLRAADNGQYVVVAHARSGSQKRRFLKQLRPDASGTVSTL
ncbi:MAG: hypothetical protein V2J89_06775 [Halieaceae bacterium]|nr:hypothetical protein [Halieaceae bacterium]